MCSARVTISSSHPVIQATRARTIDRGITIMGKISKELTVFLPKDMSKTKKVKVTV